MSGRSKLSVIKHTDNHSNHDVKSSYITLFDRRRKHNLNRNTEMKKYYMILITRFNPLFSKELFTRRNNEIANVNLYRTGKYSSFLVGSPKYAYMEDITII